MNIHTVVVNLIIAGVVTLLIALPAIIDLICGDDKE